MTKLEIFTKEEETVRRKLESSILKRIEDLHLNDEALAEVLGLLPAGADILKMRLQNWEKIDIGKLIRVANCLGIHVDIQILT